MIVNASIVRIDRRTDAALGGDEVFTAGPARAIDCFLDAVTETQRREFGATIEDSSFAVFVDKVDLAAAGEVPPGSSDDHRTGDRMVIATEDGEQVFGQVVFVGNRVKAGMSHWECFLKRVLNT